MATLFWICTAHAANRRDVQDVEAVWTVLVGFCFDLWNGNFSIENGFSRLARRPALWLAYFSTFFLLLLYDISSVRYIPCAVFFFSFFWVRRSLWHMR